MENGRVLFDASAYMLFESSGDSDQVTVVEEEYPDVAEDDAESCSCAYGSVSAAARAQGGVVCEDEFNGVDDGECDRRAEEEDGVCSDDEEGVVEQCRGGGKVEESKSCDESDNVNEREKDRLFWEGCLAS